MDRRIEKLKERLGEYRRFESYLGKDFERPIQSLEDGYPETTISLIGIILESILKFIWNREGISGDPSRRTLHDLLQACNNHIDSRRAYDYMIDLQRLRNRAVHDISGESVDRADAVEAIRKLIEILKWFQKKIGSAKSEQPVIELDPDVEHMLDFISGFCEILDYRRKEASTISKHTFYLLLERHQGVRYTYLELLISNSLEDIRSIASKNEKGLLKTKYPKHTRYVITDLNQNQKTLRDLRDSVKIGSLEAFVEDYFDYGAYAENIASETSGLTRRANRVPMRGRLLAYKPSIQDYETTNIRRIDEFRTEVVQPDFGNLLVLADAGGGKTQFCRRLVSEFMHGDINDYVFYFDLSRMDPRENIEDFITKQLKPFVRVSQHHIVDLYNYVCRAGYVVTVLDGFDEICKSRSMGQVLSIFSEIAKLFSKRSRVILSSRASFFTGTKHMRELIHRDALVSDRVNSGLVKVGIDPLQLPRFQVLRLDPISLPRDTSSPKYERILRESGLRTTEVRPLEYILLSELTVSKVAECVDEETVSRLSTAKLIYTYLQNEIERVGLASLWNSLVTFFQRQFENGSTTYSLIDIHAHFGGRLFPDGIVTYDSMALQSLFRAHEKNHIQFRHQIFLEYLFAHGFVESREISRPKLFISEQVRAFIREISDDPTFFDLGAGPELSPYRPEPGFYVVGQEDTLQIRYLDHAAELDPHVVTVAQYKEFLGATRQGDVSEFEHPDQPSDWNHEPFLEKLKIADYYSDSSYENHPAVCISWWSAYACARYFGKRLPTSFEWECASRGLYGYLFSWGDQFDLSIANCADYWAEKPLINYEEWREHCYSDSRRGGEATPVDSFSENVSPYQIRNMCGNVWEWTQNTNDVPDRAIICGGSYDNPYRAIRAASKGVYRLSGRSNAVGFRLCRDVS